MQNSASRAPQARCPDHATPIAACLRCFAARQWQPKLDKLAARRERAEAAYNKALNAYLAAQNAEDSAVALASTAVGLART